MLLVDRANDRSVFSSSGLSLSVVVPPICIITFRCRNRSLFGSSNGDDESPPLSSSDDDVLSDEEWFDVDEDLCSSSGASSPSCCNPPDRFNSPFNTSLRFVGEKDDASPIPLIPTLLPNVRLLPDRFDRVDRSLARPDLLLPETAENRPDIQENREWFDSCVVSLMSALEAGENGRDIPPPAEVDAAFVGDLRFPSCRGGPLVSISLSSVSLYPILCRDSLRPIKAVPYRSSKILLASAAAAFRGEEIIGC